MIYAKNSAARFHYEIHKEFTAGMVLKGAEVRAIRQSSIQIKGSYIKLSPEGVILIGANIGRYNNDSQGITPTKRNITLLLRDTELHKIIIDMKSGGSTLVPLKVIPQGRLIKCIIGLATGKKKYDKRHAIKARDIQRRKLAVSI